MIDDLIISTEKQPVGNKNNVKREREREMDRSPSQWIMESAAEAW
jgi:hypothetical protein